MQNLIKNKTRYYITFCAMSRLLKSSIIQWSDGDNVPDVHMETWMNGVRMNKCKRFRVKTWLWSLLNILSLLWQFSSIDNLINYRKYLAIYRRKRKLFILEINNICDIYNI